MLHRTKAIGPVASNLGPLSSLCVAGRDDDGDTATIDAAASGGPED